MNKKILIGSIIAVVILTLVSFSSVVGYNSVYKNPIPDLDCDGQFDLVEIELGETISGVITVVNIGEPLSELNWEISEYPDWCIWTFTPSFGYGLTPEQGDIMVFCEAIVQELPEEEVWDEIIIVNIDNLDDYCIVYVHYKPESIIKDFNLEDLQEKLDSITLDELKDIEVLDGVRHPIIYELLCIYIPIRAESVMKFLNFVVELLPRHINSPIFVILYQWLYVRLYYFVGTLQFTADILGWNWDLPEVDLGW